MVSVKIAQRISLYVDAVQSEVVEDGGRPVKIPKNSKMF